MGRENTTHDIKAHGARIAQVLHDGAGQLVFALRLGLADLEREADAPTRRKIDELLRIANDLDLQLQCTEEELVPGFLDRGLIPALRHVIKRISRTAGVRVTFTHEPVPRLAEDVEVSLYRAVYEALMNICRHAQATIAFVALYYDASGVVCTIGDNGVGLRHLGQSGGRGAGLGLSGMRARMARIGGAVDVTSRPGQGTRVVIHVPVPGEIAHAS
jgi:signal transduction histidine kinase